MHENNTHRRPALILNRAEPNTGSETELRLPYEGDGKNQILCFPLQRWENPSNRGRRAYGLSWKTCRYCVTCGISPIEETEGCWMQAGRGVPAVVSPSL